MKKLIKLLPVIAIFAMMVSCEDNEKSPLPATADGVFVTIDIESPVIDVTDIENSRYGGTLKDPVGNVASHTFSVRRVSNGVASSFADVYTATSFPADFGVTAGEIAAAIGIDPASILPGDRFDFVGTSVGVNGEVVTFNTLNADLQAETGQRQAYSLVTFISCPFDRDQVLGTWELIDGGFAGIVGHQFEVTADPDAADEIILDNPFGEIEPNVEFNPHVKIDPVGIAELPEDKSVDPPNSRGYEYFESSVGCCGNRFAPTRIVGDGFLFACTGFMTFTSNVSTLEEVNPPTGSIFSWNGDPSLVAQKIN